ncbi:MAG: hypothetical protein E7256_08665 [Lachnospiraceae bacterium]|nr:hypothetical protein [Lachnospiraceae bacterium]
MKNINTIHAVSASGYYYSNWQDPNKLWWDYGHSGKPSYKTFSLSPNDGTLTSVLHALTSSQNLIDHSATGGTIKLSFDLASDSPYTYNGKDYTKIGSVTMTINVSETDTVDDILKRLASISGADIDAGTASTNKPSSSTYSNTSSDNNVMFDSPIFKYQNSVHIQAGANSGQSIMMAYDSLNLYQLGIKDTSVTSRESAQNAIRQVDSAMEAISEQRSIFGSFQNRFEHAKNNAENTAENTTAAESRIRDANIAKIMVQYSKYNILMQASQSMLANANQSKQNVLDLLQP